MTRKKVLVIGSGGREHALGWNIAQSDAVGEVIYAPGNAGTAHEMKGRNVSLDATKKEHFSDVAHLIQDQGIDLTVVGPEAPLDDGIIDYLQEKGITRVFGPTSNVAAVESDKAWSHALMENLSIPHAASIICMDHESAKSAIRERATEKGVVIKARGLTGGKGVYVCDSANEALARIDEHQRNFGENVLIAERLFGEEFSLFALTDGITVSPLEISVQDHKRLHHGDTGPNTGGMGAYAPALHLASPDLVRCISDTMLIPLVQHLKKNNTPYRGFLYAGMIMTAEGPKVLEFNIRFGDPEAQAAMMMLNGSLYESISLALEGKLDQLQPQFNPGAALCVVMVSQGYPGLYEKGIRLLGLHEAADVPGVKIFHAGTKEEEGIVKTSGGRVLGVTAHSSSGLEHAQKLAYHAVSKIHLERGDLFYRNDIGHKGIRSSS